MSDEIKCERQYGLFACPPYTCSRPFGHSGSHWDTEDNPVRGGRNELDEQRTLAVLRMRFEREAAISATEERP